MKQQTRELLHALLLIAFITCGISFTLPNEANATLRAVAGASGGPLVPSATCANTGGVIYASAGTFTCNSNFTTDGAGAVSASVSVTAPTATYTTININTGGGIVGTVTNNNAPAGAVGEILTSSVASTGATVSITSGTPVTVVSTGSVVTAGDWDVTGVVCFITQTTTSITIYTQGVSTTSNVLGALGSYTAEQQAAEIPGQTTTGEVCKLVPVVRVSLAGTSNVFLVTKDTFSAGTLVGYGFMRLRRMR